MLGTLMFAAQIVLEALPNIHLSGMFTMLFAVVYRKKALIPIYLYVFLIGIRWGFSPSWIPYLYLWLILWGVSVLLPRRMKNRVKAIVYPLVCSLFGLFFGILYAPLQALLFGFDFKTTLLWIASGFPFDAIHAVGNLAAGSLVLPLSILLEKLNRRM